MIIFVILTIMIILLVLIINIIIIMVINITAIIYFVVTAIHKINFLIAIYINNSETFVFVDSS